MSNGQLNWNQILLDCQIMCESRRQNAGKNISDEASVHEVVSIMASIYSLNDKQQETLAKSLFEKLYIQMDTGIAVVDKNTYKPWLDDRRADIKPFYWERYRLLLRSKGWGDKEVLHIGTEADKILDYLGNPIESSVWKRRGLIMGDVQSGKTANYTALCNKAMDAGYKVIIVLTGTQESLRKQTQERLDHELVGFASEMYLDLEKATQKQRVGVGMIDPEHDVATFTSKANDFDQKLLRTLGFKIMSYPDPVLFVVKKQKQRLTYLYQWLKRENAGTDGRIDSPLLLIDDEADNASINTKSEDSPTAINEGIRKLLHLFNRFSYVGITATPYANIFIDPDSAINEIDNLFPSDFIYSLTAPSNYIGAKYYFGEEVSSDRVIRISDAEGAFPIGHKKDELPSYLPDSLCDALSYFILANAVMDIRLLSPKHRSMLVHVSRYIAVHKELETLIQLWLDDMKRDIFNYSGLPVEKALTNSSIFKLKGMWDEFQLKGDCSWEVLQQEYLHKAVAPIRIMVVNQKGSRLDYSQFEENGLRVIAIGGDSLSRGLTLEGLCVSYFYRNSKAYDTLLQMGRWFGYRPNYKDLCKLWLSQDSIDSFIHITDATEELREAIFEMIRYNLSPKEYGLMVRNHPNRVDSAVGRLMVTARNKMQHTAEYQHTVSVNGKLFETPRLPGDINLLEENYKNAISFITELMKYKSITSDNPNIYVQPNARLWERIPSDIVGPLVRNFRTDPLYFTFQSDVLANHIENSQMLGHWDVVVVSGSAEKKNIGNLEVQFEERIADTGREGQIIRINRAKSRVGSRGSTSNGLLKHSYEDTIAYYKDKKENPSDNAFLIQGRRPLLILHFIKIKPYSDDMLIREIADNLEVRDIGLVALGVGFPRSLEGENYHTVNYIINKIKLQELQSIMKYDNSTEDDDFDN